MCELECGQVLDSSLRLGSLLCFYSLFLSWTLSPKKPLQVAEICEQNKHPTFCSSATSFSAWTTDHYAVSHTGCRSRVSINKLSNAIYISQENTKETLLINLKSTVNYMQEGKHFYHGSVDRFSQLPKLVKENLLISEASFMQSSPLMRKGSFLTEGKLSWSIQWRQQVWVDRCRKEVSVGEGRRGTAVGYGSRRPAEGELCCGQWFWVFVMEFLFYYFAY